MKKKWRCEMKDLKIQWINKIPPPEERNPELFYYDIRNSDIDDGYTIEKGVLVNNIGSLVTNKEILGNKKFITDKELESLHYEEVEDLYVKHNSIESDIELE
jgi:hypothetical protein